MKYGERILGDFAHINTHLIVVMIFEVKTAEPILKRISLLKKTSKKARQLPSAILKQNGDRSKFKTFRILLRVPKAGLNACVNYKTMNTE